jgi:hypothetical protein
MFAKLGQSELSLMLWGLLCLCYPKASTARLVNADIRLELSINEHLAASKEAQAKFRREYILTVKNRLRTLRRNFFRSFVLLLTATAVALLVSYVSGHRAVSWFGMASVFFLAWSTLARLGYSGKSFAGNSVIERLDDRIFKALFWIGTFFGILALAA